MNQPITFAICGFGNRGRDAYAVYQKTHPDLMKIVAVADPVPQRLAAARQEYGVDPALCFDSAEALLARPRLADVMIIATQDRQHVPEALAALDLGYHLLLEKPISPELSDCMALLDKAHATGRLVMVCHVLRYTAFYSRLKELIDQGVVGVIQTLDAVENVGYYHQAHSFVRGNWRSSEETSPMILAKSCHDMDIIRYRALCACVLLRPPRALYRGQRTSGKRRALPGLRGAKGAVSLRCGKNLSHQPADRPAAWKQRLARIGAGARAHRGERAQSPARGALWPLRIPLR